MMESGILNKLATVLSRASPLSQQSVISTIHFFGAAYRDAITGHEELIKQLTAVLDKGEPRVRVRLVDLFQKFKSTPFLVNLASNNQLLMSYCTYKFLFRALNRMHLRRQHRFRSCFP
jgi:hypothetical protein